VGKSEHQARADGLLPGVNDKYGYWLFVLAGADPLSFKMILTVAPDWLTR